MEENQRAYPTPKVYLAAPFFNPQQVKIVSDLENLILQSGWRMFSPRKGEAAVEMNNLIQKKIAQRKVIESGIMPPGIMIPDPSPELRLRVFGDNVDNIDDADLLLAVVDDRDSGVMFEIGYAFRAHVPIVTYTANNYGSNLMLAHSIIGHTKTLEDVAEVLRIGNPALALNRDFKDYGAAVAAIQHLFKSEIALKEGPDEHRK